MTFKVKVVIDDDSLDDLKEEIERSINRSIKKAMKEYEYNQFKVTRLDYLIDALVRKGLIERSEV